MKILVLTTIYPELHRDDLKKDTEAIRYFVKQWVQDGHSVKVIHNYLHPVKEICKFNAFQYSRKINVSTLDGAEIFLMEHQLLWPKAGKLISVFQKTAAEHLNRFFQANYPGYIPDVILVHFPSYQRGIIDGLSFNSPKIAVMHQTDVRIIKSIRKQREIDKIFKDYTAVGFRANYIRKFFKEKVNSPAETFTVYSGIPSEYLVEETAKVDEIEKVDEAEIHKGKLKILYAGNLIKRKNVDTIIKSLNRISDIVPFHCDIIGDGVEKQNIIKIIEAHNLKGQVDLHSRLPREEVVQAMRESDLFVMVSRDETFGLVYLEAMSQGNIVIGSRDEGIDGVIIDGVNGFLVEAGNSEELAARIHEIYALSGDEKKRISKAAKETVNNMTDEIMANNYLRYVEKIVKGGR